MNSQGSPLPIPSSSNSNKRRKMSQSSSQEKYKKQSSDEMHSEDNSDEEEESSQGWSSQVIEPAIKTMTFRARRGTRMKELMKGKPKNDVFWNRYQGYFGGGLDEPQDEEDQEDYEASSSGRDEFDSDFDLTDSYQGKRGRKKGSKVKKRNKIIKKDTPIGEKSRRGRKKKVVEESSQDKKESQHSQKIEQISTSEAAGKIEAVGQQNRKRKMEICSDREGAVQIQPQAAIIIAEQAQIIVPPLEVIQNECPLLQ